MDELNKAHKDGVVVGLRNASGIGVRQDIDTMLLKHPDTFNLMVIALLELMVVKVPWTIDPGYETKVTDKFSWFEMAGIHGLPSRDWDGVKGRPGSGDGEPETGYCVHGYPTFEAWHRPYLAMLEQALYRQIQNIAERFSRSKVLSNADKQKYHDAAKSFRLPYYDYFRPREFMRIIPGVKQTEKDKTAAPYDFSLPQIFTMPRIVIKSLPDNQRMYTRNPFYQYRLPPNCFSEKEWEAADLDKNNQALKERTMRYGLDKPRSVGWMNDNLNKIREDILRLTLNLIESGPYEQLGNVTTSNITTSVADPSINTESAADKEKETGLVRVPSGSLESVHNSYHVYLGGQVERGTSEISVGHMISVPVAAFDPVFWFHHCQIDRLFAIWQAANPNSWFEGLPPQYYKLKLDEAPMYPFRRYNNSGDSKTSWWTPNLARDTETFGYTYPDLKNVTGGPAEVRKNFKHDYAWSRRLEPGSIVGHDQKPPDNMRPLNVEKAQVYGYDAGSTEEYLFEPLSPEPPDAHVFNLLSTSVNFERPTNRVSHEWYIDDHVERLAMKGSFTIFYIIQLDGVHGHTGAKWIKQPGFVGLTHVFAAPPVLCSNCENQENERLVVTNTVPITSLLLDYVETGKLSSMTADDVRPFLIKNLRWRIQTATGKVVDSRELARNHQFKVSVSCKTAPIPRDDEEEVNPDDITYASYDDITAAIISGASPEPSLRAN